MLALANTLRNVAKSQKDITLGTFKALGNGRGVRLPKIATVFVPKGPKRYVRKKKIQTLTTPKRPVGRPRTPSPII
jgi:hypothetical protein